MWNNQVFSRKSTNKRKAVLITVVFLTAVLSGILSIEARHADTEFLLPDTTPAEIMSNRRTQADPDAPPVKNRLDLEGYEKKLENNRLELWFRESLDAIRVVDKQSGYVWGALSQDKPEELNKKWSAMAHSLCTLEYYDEQNKETRVSLSDAAVSTQYSWADSAMTCAVQLKKQGISLTFRMILEEDGITFAVKDDSIEEKGDYWLKSLYFVPFLGCTLEDELDGYMFVPDGPGALIRYAKAASYVSHFEKKVYGMDVATDRTQSANDLMANRPNDYMVEEPTIVMPVYGIVHGVRQNAVFAEIESGEEYASILAYPAGVTTPYNWVSARFDYRQTYEQPIGREGSGITRVQQERNHMSPQIRFRFLNGKQADYNGMAVVYRNILNEKGIIGKERIDEDIPLRLDMVGTEIKKGFLFNGQSLLTTVQDASAIIDSLRGLKINNLTVTYKGWQKGGFSGARFGNLDFASRVGSRKDFERLRDMITQEGGRFYLSFNPSTANEDQIRPASYASGMLSRQLARKTRSNSDIMYDETYFIQPAKATSLINKAYQTLTGFDLHIEGAGSLLYSDFTRDKTVVRSEAKAQLLEALKALEETGVALNGGNSFLWGNMEELFDIPVVNSQYLFETDTVPFLQIVLKGHIDYYAPYVNQGGYSQGAILKMIEYGAYPSFFITGAENRALVNTPLEEYFSLNYDDWKASIENVYSQVNRALVPVEGREIREHRVIRPGLVRILYEGDVRLYVNYNPQDEKADDTVVPACGFIVKGAGES